MWFCFRLALGLCARCLHNLASSVLLPSAVTQRLIGRRRLPLWCTGTRAISSLYDGACEDPPRLPCDLHVGAVSSARIS